MPIYKTSGNLLIYRGRKTAELNYRRELSKRIIDKFGKGPFEQEVISQILAFCLEYYIEQFTKICHSEASYTFYKNIFWFHEQATEVIRRDLPDEEMPKEIRGNYIGAYRRILKFIIEMGCEVKMTSGEKSNDAYRQRVELIMDDLLFLGEMMVTCVELYAEQRMIEDVADITFDKDDLYVFSRRHHYEYIFNHLAEAAQSQATKHVVDPKWFPDFTNALHRCFNLKFEDVGHLVASIHQELKLDHGNVAAVGWETFIVNMNNLFGVSEPTAEQFFGGLRLDASNKMTLRDLICKPYNLNRFIYRPIVVWNIDGKDYGVFGTNSWTESFIQLTTNAIPWGKAPKEWLTDPCFKKYVHSKEDEHDKWLDDEVESRIKNAGLFYDKNVKRINADTGGVNIDVPGLGEIDFIIVCPKKKVIFVADCKHLLGRYDMVNQKNDFNAFAVGSNKTKPYNQTMSNKLAWFRQHVDLLETHFRLKYKNTALSLRDFQIEGIFIVNSPTFYMYNADYRIYTLDQIVAVLNGEYEDPTFMVVIEEDDAERIINVKYPFFRKPEYLYFDPEYDEDVPSE